MKVLDARAFAVIDLEALKHNYTELKKHLPSGCEIMAVMKTNAYGHGDWQLARFLGTLGCRSFAVADADEGIRLREHQVEGDILILGYTHPSRAEDLVKYDIMTAAVSAEHMKALDQTGLPVKVHVKLDTGMHRLGTPCSSGELIGMYQTKNLIVRGTFSHLAMAESLEKADTEFTESQTALFDSTVSRLREAGISPGKLHLQNSYGASNWSRLKYDYVRPGLLLFGIKSSMHDVLTTDAVYKPILSLRARIGLVKSIRAGELAGYNRHFTAEKDTVIAIAAIGYGDGIPKCYYTGGGEAVVKGRRARIIDINMDQLILDVTEHDRVEMGDTATFIGRDGNECITAEEMAEKSGTITNEIFSKLSARVKRIYTGGVIK